MESSIPNNINNFSDSSCASPFAKCYLLLFGHCYLNPLKDEADLLLGRMAAEQQAPVSSPRPGGAFSCVLAVSMYTPLYEQPSYKKPSQCTLALRKFSVIPLCFFRELWTCIELILVLWRLLQSTLLHRKRKQVFFLCLSNHPQNESVFNISRDSWASQNMDFHMCVFLQVVSWMVFHDPRCSSSKSNYESFERTFGIRSTSRSQSRLWTLVFSENTLRKCVYT